ncbi:MAG: single-stranded-DNA-specific exonuclease RecJ [Rhodobacterales bacterium]|nr:single-stranded-DNA-specific exonuclease RecJ [Rhodobacterales bacterium]
MTQVLSLTGARWQEVDNDSERVQRIQSASGLTEIAARIIAARWTEDLPTSAWATPSLDDLHDPMTMLNMGVAVERLRFAVEQGQKVRIITDYDVDGTTSSLILQAAMRLSGPNCNISYHIPNRFVEGYGFSTIAARAAVEDGVDLIITADIGVRDHAAVDEAKAGGVDVLICDHHLPAGESVPENAIVLCPPQQGCTYANASLAACGVSLKVAQALLKDHRLVDRIIPSMLKLAAVGTVADLVPLTTAENRAIVTLGLQGLNEQRHNAGLSALLKVSNCVPGEIKASDLGFRIGPRIHAAGRVAAATLVVHLLTSRDVATAGPLAEELNALSDKRRTIQAKVEEEALAMVSDPPPPFIVVAERGEAGWHRGVVGIVASRLKDQFHRPVAVIAIQGERAVGSVRSVTTVHAVRALDSVSDLLEKYGGHPAAAGFSVPADKLDELRERLCAYVDNGATNDDMAAVRMFDSQLPPDALTMNLHHSLERLGPWGMKNPKPRLLLRGIQVRNIRRIGKDKTHLKLKIPVGPGVSIDALWWRAAEYIDVLESGPVDVLGALGENTYRGRTTLQFEITDARPA